MKKRMFAVLLALALAVSLTPMAAAYDADKAETAAKAAVAAIKKEEPAFGSEWLMVSDATYTYCGFDESYRSAYYNNLKAHLDENDGGLGVNRFTEYERVIIAVTAMGYDAADIGGHDLLRRLADYNDVKKQGINSIAFGLIALDSGCYDMPSVPGVTDPNSRKKMVDNILSREIEGGGFALYGKAADADITAMALQALSRYTYRADVRAAVERAVAELSRQQLPNGSFASLSGLSTEGTAESTAQVVLALTALGISVDDPHFTKDVSLMDALLAFQLPDGSFRHLMSDAEGDYAATLQSLHALSAAARFAGNGTPAYVYSVPESSRFTDVVYNDYRAEIEALAELGIIDGMTDTTFEPEATMTRAQFAAIVVRTLGLEQKTVTVFEDVPADEWYAGVVGAAYSAGIIQGCSDTIFDPEGTITDIEAFIMLSRAAGISGIEESEPEWYASEYDITRGEVAGEVYVLYNRLKEI
ncbi:MAG: S-layer homology domain-containing protein [Clostridiales bacterium]|nr:S-layer homology domain-containing protein [Clostridiales bacterium]